MDHFAYSLIEGWKRGGTLQDHTIHHLYLKEGFSCVKGIQNRDAVLLYEANPVCLARFLPFFQPGYGFVWAAFCIDSVGNIGEDPLALVSRERMDVFTLHATRLDPCLGPRILRIAPLLGLRDATPTGAGDGALCYPTAIILDDLVQDGGDMRP